jgi:hypothetical protein
MAGTPYLICGNSAASGGATSLTQTVNVNVPTEDCIWLGVLVSAAGVTVSVTDSQNNVYSQFLADTTETSAQLYVFNVANAIPLTAAVDTITVKYSANTSVQAFVAVGDDNVSQPDKAIIAHGSGTAVSTGSSGTLSQAEEHAIVFICNAFAGGNPTYGAPWNAEVLALQGAGTTAILSAAYTDVTATTALTGTATIVSAAWTAALITDEVNPISFNMPNALADGIINEAYSQTLEATGGVSPYTYAVTTGSLPPGLTLVAGVVSGTPTTAGSYTFTLTITDSASITATTTQTVVILASGASVAPALTLPNNLLSAADSDFEVTGFTWAADTNANAPARSANAAFTGSECLAWSAAADGMTQISTGFYAATAGKPYIVSAACLPAGVRDLFVGVEWYTSGNSLISTTFGDDNPSPGDEWQALTAALTAPATTAKCKVVVQVGNANKGEVTHIDLAYLAQSDIQVLIDWVNDPYVTGSNAGQDFMDVSPFVRLDLGVTMNRGRQDAISEIQPGSATFQLQNDTGVFTCGKNATPVVVLGGQVTTQRRCQVNMTDQAGVWYTRFDGPLSEVDYTIDNTAKTALASVSVTDVLGFLNRQDEMVCWTKEQVLSDSPLYHWTLNDLGNSGGFGVAAESSGNNGPPLRAVSSDSSGTATIAWADSSGGVETLADAVAPGEPDGSEFWSAGTDLPSSQVRGLDSGNVGPYTTPLASPLFTPKLSAASGQNDYVSNLGYMLTTQLPQPITTNVDGVNFAVEAWFAMSPNIAADVASDYGPYTVFSLGNSRTGETMVVTIAPATNHLTLQVWEYHQPPAFALKNFSTASIPSASGQIAWDISSDTVPLPHHVVVTIFGDPSFPSVYAYLDGAIATDSGTTFNLSAGTSYDTICVGSAFGGTGAFSGNIQMVSIYNDALWENQVVQHCQMGQYGMWESPTDDCIATLANFAGIPVYWTNLAANHNGLSLTDYLDITGTTPLANMQLYEQSEMGLLFVNSTGQLTFHTRDWRMGYGAPDLQLPADTYDGAFGYEVIDQFQINEQAVSTLIFQSGASYVNATSKGRYGTYATNGVGDPLELPLISWNRAYSQLGEASFYYWTDPYLSDYCAWIANTRSDPWFVPGQLTIDLKTLNPNSGLTIASFYALDIDNMIVPHFAGTQPPSFPDGSAIVEWLIEGIQETYNTNGRTIQFYCSPAQNQRAWRPGDTTYGVLGSTSRIGVSAPDTSQPQADGKDVSHDAGGPYWPPSFTSDMNNPSQNSHGFIGAVDMRGLVNTLQTMLEPPLCVVSAQSKTQSMTTGATTAAAPLFWDTIHVDTSGGMGLAPGWPNWFVCTVAGWYEIDACVPWATGSFTDGDLTQSWIVVALEGAQAIAAGLTPLNVDQYLCPIGSAQKAPGTGDTRTNPTNNPSTMMYLGVGDMVAVAAQHNHGSSVNTAGSGNGGCQLSIRFCGYGTTDDRVQVNTALTGGTVTNPTPSPLQQPKTTKTYQCVSTAAYSGPTGLHKNARRNTNGSVYQCVTSGNLKVTGSQISLIVLPWAQMQSDLAGQTISSITLKCVNQQTYYASGKLILGWSRRTSLPGTYVTQSANDHVNLFQELFKQGETKTFALPVSTFGTALATEAGMLLVGDDSSTNLEYYGLWQGGPNSWTLTITYY